MEIEQREPGVGERLEAGLFELRVQALFRVARILNIHAAVNDVRAVVGDMSDEDVIDHLASIQQSRFPRDGRLSNWWSAALSWLRKHS